MNFLPKTPNSGFGSLGLIRFPAKRDSDLSSCILGFTAGTSIGFLFFYILSSFLLSRMLSSKLKLHEGFLFIYRIMMKEHNLNAVKSLANGNLPASFLLCGLLLYYLLFSLIVEQSVSATQ